MIIHLVGSGQGWEDAPELSDEHEVWGLNCVLSIRRGNDMSLDKMFNMHDPKTVNFAQKATMCFAEQEGIPIVMQKDYGFLNTVVVYPLGEVLEMFGRKYFTNSVAYMIAYAMYYGATEIYLWGLKMAPGDRDATEKAGMEYWLGVAEGRGIKIHTQESSALLKTDDKNSLYGYEKKFNHRLSPTGEELDGESIS